MDTNPEENETNSEHNIEKSQTETAHEIAFKKPTLLIGKRGRLPRKLQTASTSKSTENSTEINTTDKSEHAEKSFEPDLRELKDKKSLQQQLSENLIPLPYKEPSWSGLPETSGKPYVFEILKNGTIIETIDLMKKSFWVFGRLATCDICMQHPTISRYHAVLQYRDTPSETDPPGFYVYDLGSTHGTFLNGKRNKLKPTVYVPIRVGHMLRLGCSQRSFILTGPEDDQEEESELSVTELKQLRAQKIKEHEEKMRQAELEREEKRKREEERGVDWGLGDDADETEDLTENPYASTTNEELYLDDPKKALRGFFEREGLELEYDCTEQGLGQFLCKVELPLDDEMGRPIFAEALHRGKKKEAVIQCALEACRILDRFGVLRQATHESRKRKTKNWEEDDYYDSDDDTFLDRTGIIEKKREKRMKAKEPEKAETYESLLEKEKQISSSIADIEKRLSVAQAKMEDNGSSNTDEDSLDSYMKGLQEHKPDRQTVSKLKFELVKLKRDHANVIRLANIAKPADLPPLIPQTIVSNLEPSTSGSKLKQVKPGLPMIGKRKAKPMKYPLKPSDNEIAPISVNQTEECEEESEEEEECENKNEELPKEYMDIVQVEDMGNIEEHISANTSSNDKEGSNNTDEYAENVSNSDNAEKSLISRKAEKTNESSTADNSHHSDSAGSSNEPQSPSRSQESIEANSDSGSDSEYADVAARRATTTEILELTPIKSFHETLTFKKFENIMRAGLPAFAGKHKEKLEKILNKLKRLASNEDRMHVDWKTLSAKKRKVIKLISDLSNSEANEKLEHRVSSELNRILNELNTMTEEKYKVIGKVQRMGNELKNISIEIDRDIKALRQGIDILGSKTSEDNTSSQSEPGPSNENSEAKDDSGDVDDKKKKKNQKRIEHRQQKAEMERQRGYEEDATRENYSMWVPPSDQSGDGRTSLNEKYGY